MNIKELIKKIEDEIIKINIPLKTSRSTTAGKGRSVIIGLTSRRREKGFTPI